MEVTCVIRLRYVVDGNRITAIGPLLFWAVASSVLESDCYDGSIHYEDFIYLALGSEKKLALVDEPPSNTIPFKYSELNGSFSLFRTRSTQISTCVQ